MHLRRYKIRSYTLPNWDNDNFKKQVLDLSTTEVKDKRPLLTCERGAVALFPLKKKSCLRAAKLQISSLSKLQMHRAPLCAVRERLKIIAPKRGIFDGQTPSLKIPRLRVSSVSSYSQPGPSTDEQKREVSFNLWNIWSASLTNTTPLAERCTHEYAVIA